MKMKALRMWLTEFINSNHHLMNNSKFFKNVLILRMKIWLKRSTHSFIWKLSTIKSSIQMSRFFDKSQKHFQRIHRRCQFVDECSDNDYVQWYSKTFWKKQKLRKMFCRTRCSRETFEWNHLFKSLFNKHHFVLLRKDSSNHHEWDSIW